MELSGWNRGLKHCLWLAGPKYDLYADPTTGVQPVWIAERTGLILSTSVSLSESQFPSSGKWAHSRPEGACGEGLRV